MSETPGQTGSGATDAEESGASANPRARSFGERLLAALKLDASVFEEVEHDPEALPQAAGVVALAAVAGGLSLIHLEGIVGVVGGVISTAVGWLLVTAIIWAIGVKAMGHTSDYVELLRTLGFAHAPQCLLVLGVLPLGPLMALVGLVVMVLSLIAFVIAVRQALDIETGRAVVVCVLAALGRLLLYAIL
jgi:hypothetical protein